jgi:hypothetical protein
MARLLMLVVAAFKAWMFIDAVRRKVDTKWFYIIVFVPAEASSTSSARSSAIQGCS